MNNRINSSIISAAASLCFILVGAEQAGAIAPPVAVCSNVTVLADSYCMANASVDAGSYSPVGSPITLSQDPPAPYPLGANTVTLTVTDTVSGLMSSCTATVTVVNACLSTFTVLNTNDAGCGSLRQAILDANACPGANTIDFDPAVTNTITLTTGELLINDDLTIVGPGPEWLAIDGNYPNTTNRVFVVEPDLVVTIASLTITNGYYFAGGGIVNGGTLTVSNCTLSGNSAYFGGGIANFDGSLAIIDSTLSGNSTIPVIEIDHPLAVLLNAGGGILNLGLQTNATLTVSGSTFSQNSAGIGGGIYNGNLSVLDFFGYSNTVSTLQITDSTLTTNVAFFGGGIFNGAISNSVAALIVSNCTLSGNSAVIKGGGIGNGNSLPTLYYVDEEPPLIDFFDLRGGAVTIVNSALSDNSVFLIALTNNPTAEYLFLASGSGGGGLYNEGDVTIVNSTLDNNSAGFPDNSFTLDEDLFFALYFLGNLGGGGILNEGGALIITNSTVSGNSSFIQGGGILNAFGPWRAVFLEPTNIFATARSATVQISDSILSSNSVGAFGAGIANGNIWSLIAPLPGGSNVVSSVQIANSALIDNSVVNDDGGLGAGIASFGGSSSYTAALRIDNSTLSGNSITATNSSLGGGIASYVTELDIANSTLSGNSVSTNANSSGGGIYLAGGSANIANSTLSSNVAAAGAEIYIQYEAALDIGSTILNNPTGSSITNDGGTVTSFGYNLSRDSGGGFLMQATDQINTDPLLGPLQDNGGPTFTHALLCGSPALDAGTNFLDTATTDQRGTGYLRTFGAATDIGAFELQELCNQPPVALCSNITVSANSNCQANASIDAGSYDMDAGDSIVSFVQSPVGPYALGNTAVTLTVTDTHGATNSCSATVTVVDTTPPTITSCAAPQTNSASASCQADVPDFTGDVTASDNCSAVTVSQSPTAGTMVGLGTTNVTLYAVDAAGNTNTCTTSFTVVDTTPPTITCPADIVANATNGACSTVVTFPDPTIGDNCSGATVSCLPASGSAFSVGTTNVVCTATDGSGNSTQCTFQVAVRACADINYTGDTGVLTAGPRISTAPVRLSAQLTAGAVCGGSITNAKVCFYLFKSSNTGTTPDSTVCDVPVTASGSATAVTSLGVDTWTVKVQINPDNQYWHECDVEMAVVNVAPGSTDKRTTGGVWVPDAQSRNGKLAAGWTVNYQKKGSPKGQWVSVLKAKDGFNYQFKSTSWQGGGLTFFSNPSKAAFTGKCVIQKIDPATGNIVDSLGAGSCTFTADVVDGDLLQPRQADKYGIRILLSPGLPAFWYDVANAATVYPVVTLGGGNVMVQSK